MTDTYNIGSLTNDATQYWKKEGYEEYTGKKLRDELDNNTLEIGQRTTDPDRTDIDKIRDGEDILVKTDDREQVRKSQQQRHLEKEINNKQSEIQDLNRQLRQQRTSRREDAEDLEDLQNELDNLQNEISDVNDQLEDLGLTPPIVTTQEVSQLNQQDRQEANDLLSKRGALNNRIGNLRQQVEDQEQTVNKLTEELDKTRNKRNQFKKDVENLKEELRNTPPNIQLKIVVSDIIIVCETEYETYISGQYRDPTSNSVTREIEARGIKKVVMGTRAPADIRNTPQEDPFWDNVYEDVKETVFRNPGGFPEGEWFDLLIDRMEELGTAGAAGQFTGSNWEWTFKDSSGGHEFPDENEMQDSKNQRCDSFNDVTLR